jgi:serine/threonine protein kinase
MWARSREEFTPGERQGEFQIIHSLGRGGMGSVYLAEDTRLGRKAALKAAS